jgi:hypothetical protein
MKKLILPISLLAILAIVITGVVFFIPKEKKVNLSLLVVDQDITSLTKDSVAIAIGTIKDILPSRLGMDNSGNRIVFTDYVLLVKNTIKGNVDEEVKIRIIGGSVGEGKNKFSVFAEDEPDFVKGEEILVFLSKNSGGFFDLPVDHYAVEGRFQGKYQIINNEARNPKGIFKLDKVMNEINSTLQIWK